MTNITATEARKNLYKLVESVSLSHVPVQISGKHNESPRVWRRAPDLSHTFVVDSMAA